MSIVIHSRIGHLFILLPDISWHPRNFLYPVYFLENPWLSGQSFPLPNWFDLYSVPSSITLLPPENYPVRLAPWEFHFPQQVKVYEILTQICFRNGASLGIWSKFLALIILNISKVMSTDKLRSILLFEYSSNFANIYTLESG